MVAMPPVSAEAPGGVGAGRVLVSGGTIPQPMAVAAPTMVSQGSPPQQLPQQFIYPQRQVVVQAAAQVPQSAPVLAAVSPPVRAVPVADPSQAPPAQTWTTTVTAPAATMQPAQVLVPAPAVAPEAIPPVGAEATVVQGATYIVGGAVVMEPEGVPHMEATLLQGAAFTAGDVVTTVEVGVSPHSEAVAAEGLVLEEPMNTQNSFVYAQQSDRAVLDAQEGVLSFQEASPGQPGQLDAGAAEDMPQGELLAFEDLQNFVGQMAETQQQHAEILNGLPGLEELLLRRIDEQVGQAMALGAEAPTAQRTDEVFQGSNAEALKEEMSALVMKQLASFEASLMQNLEGRLSVGDEQVCSLQAQIDQLRVEAGSPSSKMQAEAPEQANLQIQIDELRTDLSCIAGEQREIVLVQLQQLQNDLAGMHSRAAQPAQQAEGQDAGLRAELEQLRADLASLARGHHETLPAQLEELRAGVARSHEHQRETAELPARFAEFEAQLVQLKQDSRLAELEAQLGQLKDELQQEDFFVNELRGMELDRKIPLIEQVQDEQKLLLRELNSLNLPMAMGRLEGAIGELQAADVRSILEPEVQALRGQLDGLQAQLDDSLLAVKGQQREQELLELEARLLETVRAEQPLPGNAVGEPALSDEVARRLQQLEESHEQHRSVLDRAGTSDVFRSQLSDVREQAQALDDRQRKHEADFLGRLQGLEEAMLQRMENVKQVRGLDALGYEPETEIQLRGMQQSMERLQEGQRQLREYIGFGKDAAVRGGPEESLELAEERVTAALEAEVQRRCMLVAELHSRLAKEVAVVSRHVELRWEELAARIEAESTARKENFAAFRRGLQVQ